MTLVAPLVGHDRYLTAEAYRAEAETVFARTWQCVGLASDDVTDRAGRRLARCGGLLFAHQDVNPPPLETALAPYFDWLAAATARLERSDRSSRVEVAANWKLLIENTLDDGHGGTLHADSLQRSFPLWRSAVEIGRHGKHSDIRHRLGPTDLAFWTRLTRRLDLARFGSGEDYRHVFLFPNFYVSSFFDAMVMLHRVEPLGPERSVLHWELCLPLATTPTIARRAVHRAVLDDLARQAARVIAEDISVCLLAQRGRHFAVHRGVLGEREQRVAGFQAQLV